MLLHRDFKEIDKEDAIHLVFLRQRGGGGRRRGGGARNDDDSRGERGEGGGESERTEAKEDWKNLGMEEDTKSRGGIGFLGVDSNDADVPCGEYLRR